MIQKHINNTMALSIIIPSYQRTVFLQQLLEKMIELSTDAQALNIEVLVVDDGSPSIADKEAMLEHLDFPFHFTLLKQENQGPASARNHGLQYAKADLIAFLDDDAIPQDNWLHEIMQGYENNPKLAGMGGYTQAFTPKTLTERFLNHVQHLHAHQFSEKGHVSYLCTVNCSFKRQALLDIKGFDESFPFAAGEDMDLSFRLRQAGYELGFNKKAFVLHHHRSTLFDLYKMFFLSGRGAFQCARKNKDFDTEHVASKELFEPMKVIYTLRDNIKNIALNFKNPKLSLFEKFAFPIMEIFTHVFYQLGRWYQKLFT